MNYQLMNWINELDLFQLMFKVNERIIEKMNGQWMKMNEIMNNTNNEHTYMTIEWNK